MGQTRGLTGLALILPSHCLFQRVETVEQAKAQQSQAGEEEMKLGSPTACCQRCV